ncbi:DEAD/DEAH box helicase family protein [Vibrio campbellii]|uniref:DEAD/DEAH box helicase family protein n=1 Tax=Vibrio campbellii TaxID=680 RepID=UPI003F82F01A
MAYTLTWLKKDAYFLSVLEKMTVNIPLDEREMEFILSCAIIFLMDYSKDRRKNRYFEFGYYIVLKCAINNKYYEPLLDVSTNYGFYPISKYIIENKLFSNDSTTEFKLDLELEKFKYNEIIETYEQKQSREVLLESDSEENCYIAPTSFGKSSLIVEIIKNKKYNKVAIIVPTKSLLIQTYKLIKRNFSGRNIIFHDEMYDGSNDFIAIFTQERALRLLKDESISFDLLIIDEAHNLFEKSARSILLTRLIRRNRKRNTKSTNYYLSPLISDSNNLKVDFNQDFFERKIINNIKEADIYEYEKNGNIRKYNRFVDCFFDLTNDYCYLNYIINNSKNKNFLYLRAPKKVEELSICLSDKLEKLDSESLNRLSDTISKNVHKDFYCVEYIKKGLVYLHGKLPDLIKEYLEYKFSNNHEVKYVVANGVILEGVNLPVDNMYILNARSLDHKSLINLIGRVNRLNEVFDIDRRSLDKLIPSIHFINSDEFNKGVKMENKIKMLKSSVFNDSLNNPLLSNFDIENLNEQLEKYINKGDVNKAIEIESKLSKYFEVLEREDFLINSNDEGPNRVKRILLESEVLSIYSDKNEAIWLLKNRIDRVQLHRDWNGAHVIDKVYLFFIEGLESYISNPKILRLRHEKARRFYKMFTDNLHRLTLKEHISGSISYFQAIKNKPEGKLFFIGDSYGEFSRDGSNGNNLYLDLSTKTSKEMANIALVKIKIESDFVSYELNDYVNVLFDLGLINESEYDLYIYGTDNKSNSEFVKLGISGSLINKLDKDGQITNLYINEFGIVECKPEFLEYLSKQDDLIQFEISKFIDI